MSDISFSSTSTMSAVEQGLDGWDETVVPASSFGVSHGTNSLTTSYEDDDLNMVAIVDFSTTSCAGGDAKATIAATVMRGEMCEGLFSDSYIEEADIYISYCHTWTSSDIYYDFHGDAGESMAFAIEQAILHEAGHAAGLDHWDGDGDESGDGYPATMNLGESGGSVIGESLFASTRRFYASEDDRAGLRYLYPGTEAVEVDLAVQSYMFFSDGDYYYDVCGDNVTRPSPYRDLSLLAVESGRDPEECPGLELWPYEPDGPLALYPTQSAEVVFNVLNLGDATAVDVDGSVWLTTDPETMSDSIEVDSWVEDISPALPWEMTHTVTIPSGTDAGIWYVVSIVDDDDSADEPDEDNNQAIWNRAIEVKELSACECSTGRPSGLAWAGVALLLAGRRRKKSGE